MTMIALSLFSDRPNSFGGYHRYGAIKVIEGSAPSDVSGSGSLFSWSDDERTAEAL